MAPVVTPGHPSDRVPVSAKYLQAVTIFRFPEPDIARAGKEPSLIGMPG